MPLEHRPPAELTRCARRPAPLPESATAVMPAPLRRALAAIATAFGANADQLDRLVDWNDPAAGCGAQAPR